jgi:hypothetical protein
MIQPDRFTGKQIMAVFLLSLLFGYLLANWYAMTVPTGSYWPLGVDIYPRWVGGHAFWQGESPYSGEVDRAIQTLIYGQPAQPSQPTFNYYYPAHTAIVLAPLLLLPLSQAALLWVSLSWATIGLSVFIIIRSLNERPSLWLLPLVGLTIFLHRSLLMVTLNGQYALFVLACWGLAAYLIWRGIDGWGGFLLVLTTIKPTLSLLPLLVILLWAFTANRHKIVYAFLVTSVFFLAISLIQIGWWVPEFIAQISQYGDVPRPWTISDILSPSGFIWLGGTTWLIYWGVKNYWADKHAFPFLLFWGAISLMLLITPHTAEYDLPILILPFVLYTPYFLRSLLGTVSWLLMWWLPWLSWATFLWLGHDTTVWQDYFWFHYPQILVIGLLAFLCFSDPRWELGISDG